LIHSIALLLIQKFLGHALHHRVFAASCCLDKWHQLDPFRRVQPDERDRRQESDVFVAILDPRQKKRDGIDRKWPELYKTVSSRHTHEAIHVSDHPNHPRQCWCCNESSFIKQVDSQSPYLSIVVAKALDQSSNQPVAVAIKKLLEGDVFGNPLLGVVQGDEGQEFLANLGHGPGLVLRAGPDLLCESQGENGPRSRLLGLRDVPPQFFGLLQRQPLEGRSQAAKGFVVIFAQVVAAVLMAEFMNH